MTFEAVTLSWKGRDYTIPPDNVLKCIAKIEDVFTLGELAGFQIRGHIPLAKVSQAYALVLRHAGAHVSDDEVYSALFASGGSDAYQVAVQAVYTLQAMMIPPEQLRAKSGKGEATSARAASSPSATSSS